MNSGFSALLSGFYLFLSSMKTLPDNISYPLSDKKNIGNLLGLEFDEDEQILWIGKPDWIIFILNSIIHAILMALFIFILFFGMNYINQTSIEHRNISGLVIFIELLIYI